MLKDTSNFGSAMAYTQEDEDAAPITSTQYPQQQVHRSMGDKKDPPTWVIPVGWVVSVRMGGCLASLSFQVPDHTACLAEYKQKVTNFKKVQNNPFAFLGGMALNTERATTMNLIAAAQNAAHDDKQGRYAWIVGNRRLGEGGFGDVYEVFNTSNWCMCAGKRMKLEVTYQKESSIMRRLKHKHIVQYVDVEERNAVSPSMIIMEYFQLGDLGNQHRKRSFAESEIIRIIAQIASALVYLHGESITHRDLKPGNILVRSREPVDVAVTDFGVSSEDTLMETYTGTYQYMAPEVLNSNFYNNKADMWSLGVVALDLLPEGLPKLVRGMKDQAYPKHIFDQRGKFIDQFKNKEFARLVKALLAYDASDRPDAEELLSEISVLVAEMPDVNNHSQETTPRREKSPAKEVTADSALSTLKALKRVGSDGITLKPPAKKPATSKPSGSRLSANRPSKRDYQAASYEAELWEALNGAPTRASSSGGNPEIVQSSCNTTRTDLLSSVGTLD